MAGGVGEVFESWSARWRAYNERCARAICNLIHERQACGCRRRLKMGKVLEMPDVLDVRVPAGLVEEVSRACGRDRKKIAAFVASAIEEKFRRETDDAGGKP